jgi:hypothetical protein
MIKFLQKLAVVWAKNANIFAKFFGKNILKIITSVPGHTDSELQNYLEYIGVQQNDRGSGGGGWTVHPFPFLT